MKNKRRTRAQSPDAYDLKTIKLSSEKRALSGIKTAEKRHKQK